LTHKEELHEVNLGWHPQAEEILWRPELQEQKYSQTGGKNVRYIRTAGHVRTNASGDIDLCAGVRLWRLPLGEETPPL